MKITFLGTGTSQGIPMIGSDHPVCLSTNPKDKRLRSSVMVTDEDFQIVIDCGPDFRMQMLNAKVTFLDGIVFTHDHADHTAGLDDVRQFSKRLGALPIYAHKNVLHHLERRYDYIFNSEVIYEGKPRVKPFEIFENQKFKIKEKEIIPIQIMHGQMAIFGFRIDDFAYLTDISFIEEIEKEKLKGLKMLVVDALRIAYHPTHFNLEQALELINELKPTTAYLTHISQRLGFHDEVQKTLPKNVQLSYDGLVVTI